MELVAVVVFVKLNTEICVMIVLLKGSTAKGGACAVICVFCDKVALVQPEGKISFPNKFVRNVSGSLCFQWVVG